MNVAIIGLDIGSGSAKASAFTPEGKHLARGTVSYSPKQPAQGIAEYNADEICQAAIGALAQLSGQLGDYTVASIAIDAMMSGAVAIDRAGRAITPYTTTLDTRFSPWLDDFVSLNASTLRKQAGSMQATLAPKSAWIKHSRPELAGKIAKYVLAGSMVGAHLAGLSADGHYIDPSYLWTTGLSDGRKSSWSKTLLNAAGLAESELPEIVPCTQIIGTLTREAAYQTGLSPGIPIAAGCGDQTAGYLGAGIDRTGIAADSAGTYAVFTVALSAFLPGDVPMMPDIAIAPQPGLFHYQHIIIGGGLTRQWAEDILLASSGDRTHSLADLERAAAAIPVGAEGLTVLPWFGGTAEPPDASRRGQITGLTWAHRAPHLYRAFLESIAIAHARHLDYFPPGTVIDQIIGYGGGVRSRLWNTIKCDVFGVPYLCLGDYPVTELGTALIGAQAVNLIEDAASAACGLRVVEAVLQPDLQRHAQYVELIKSRDA